MPDKTPKNNTKKSKLNKAVSSSVSSSKKQKNKPNSDEMASYLKQNFPLIISLISELKNNVDKNNKQQTEKLSNIEKHSAKNNNQNTQLHSTLQDSKKLLSSIVEKLQEANDQRSLAADLEEERIAEDKKEKAILEENRAKDLEKNNAQIITKLTDLNDTLGGLDISGGGSKSGGIFSSLLSMIPNLLSSLLPMIMTGLASLGAAIGTLFSTLLPFILPLIVAALAGGAGYAIFKTYIEPWMDERQQRVQGALREVLGGAATKTEQVTTDKGEKVFQREDTKTGQMTYVSESQMKSELASMSEQDRAKVQSGEGSVSYTAAENVIDVQSGMYTNATPIQSGKSIEEINQIAKETAESRAGMSENMKAHAQYAKEIVNFDESFRQQLAITMTAWGREGGPGTSMSGARENFTIALEKLFNEHMMLINRIRGDSTLQPQDRAELMKLSPLFDEAFGENQGEGEDPDYDWWPSLGYDLPNGEGITLDWGNSSTNMEENLKAINEEFGTASSKASTIKQKYDAKAVLQQLREKEEADFYKRLEKEQGQGLETPPAAADGAVVYPKTGKGVLTNISEDMKPEAVVPLDRYVISEKGSAEVEPVNLSEKATTAMRSTYFEEKEASQGSQAPVIINNVNNNRGGGSGGAEGANFQFQTDLAKTFDNVFDMILEKNMRTGLA